ncbi:hypothetical protein GGR57DRAFT_495904 [Xylariaceae sp. FL1272]|nr:hypothetical protein GGR57DRAFT_495904 [Xylariaceae sp. FL1272]
MDITNARRILAVSSGDSAQHLVRVIKDLTGTTPEPTGTSLAGTTHNLSLKNAYYTADVPIWIDLIASPSEWSASFLSPEAKEVLDVLGGVMIVFPLPMAPRSDEARSAKDLINHVGKVVKDGLGGWEWDGVRLCLGVGEIDDVDEWEDCCAEWGLEFVQVRKQSTPTRNEYGEKTGIPRALDALESNDWANTAADGLGSDFEDIEAEIEADKERQKQDDDNGDQDGPDLDPESLDFGFDREDFDGLKRAIWSSGHEDDAFMNSGIKNDNTEIVTEEPRDKGNDEALDDEEIQKIERMMTKLQAVRDTNAGLPEDQRKRAAAKAVAEVMKEL